MTIGILSAWEAGLISQLRKIMEAKGVELREVYFSDPVNYELYTKSGVSLEGPHSLRVWAERIFEHKIHEAAIAADAKKESEK